MLTPEFHNRLLKLTANREGQELLREIVVQLQALMGIGGGGHCGTSGESVAVHSLLANATPPYCVFDVGAAKGTYLDLLAPLLAPTSHQIHCFEPSAAAFRALQSRADDGLNVTLNNRALGATSERATLWADRPGSALGSLERRRLEHFGLAFEHSETVEVTTLDAYCDVHGIADIALLKVDVEGRELDVLEGASHRLTNGQIRSVLFEFGGASIDAGRYFQDYFYFFQSMQMHLWRITPLGYLYPIEFYDEALEQFRTSNYAATVWR